MRARWPGTGRRPVRCAYALALAAVTLACSSKSSSGGGASTPGDADAAVGEACATANEPPETNCPVAPGGSCHQGTCDPKSLPTGLSCTARVCIALIDSCPDLAANSRTDYYACSCVQGKWACGLCAPGAAECVDAGADGAP